MADCPSVVRDTGWGKTGQPDLPHQYLPGVWPVYLQMAEGAFLLSFLLSEAGVDLPGNTFITLLPKGTFAARQLLDSLSTPSSEPSRSIPSFPAFAKGYNLSANVNYALAILYYLEKVLGESNRSAARLCEIWEASGRPAPPKYSVVFQHMRDKRAPYAGIDSDSNYFLLPRGVSHIIELRNAAQ